MDGRVTGMSVKRFERTEDGVNENDVVSCCHEKSTLKSTTILTVAARRNMVHRSRLLLAKRAMAKD